MDRGGCLSLLPQTSCSQVVATLDQLLGGAEAGAFEAYLRMLRSFQRQMAAEVACTHSSYTRQRKNSYRSILYNLSTYYSQFCEPLAQAVATQRSTIEKKLADYAKLCQVTFPYLSKMTTRTHAPFDV